MRMYKCADIHQDLTIYPRCAVDYGHVAVLAAAIENGQEMPPIVICSKTHKLVDGFHRLNATMRVKGPDAEIQIVEKEYASEREMFLDAIRYNAKHGQPLSVSDRQHCLLSCKRFGCDDADVAKAIGVKTSALGPLTVSANKDAILRGPASRTREHEVDEDQGEQDTAHQMPLSELRSAEQAVIDAAVKWHRSEESEFEQAIDALSVAVAQYLTVKSRRRSA